jgi:hypothetical protein
VPALPGEESARRGQERRSAGRNAGRDTCRRSTASSCRSTTISSSLKPDERKRSRISVITRPTITYKNDASTRLLPSSTEPATLRARSDQNARRQRTIEFWHPTGSTWRAQRGALPRPVGDAPGVTDRPRSRNQWPPLPASRLSRAVGGFRAWTEDAGRRANSTTTLLPFKGISASDPRASTTERPVGDLVMSAMLAELTVSARGRPDDRRGLGLGSPPASTAPSCRLQRLESP